MRKYMSALIIMFMLAGCGYSLQSPLTTIPTITPNQNPIFPIVTAIQDTSIQIIDGLCPPVVVNPIPGDKGFLQGIMDADPSFAKEVLTVQQNEDVLRLMTLCATPKENRMMYDYGFLTRRGVQNLFSAGLQVYKLVK